MLNELKVKIKLHPSLHYCNASFSTMELQKEKDD